MKVILGHSARILLIVMLVLSALGSNYVLCIGADGHVSLELSNVASRCVSSCSSDHSDGESDDNHNTYSFSEEPCCHHCVDIPLLAARDTYIHDERSVFLRNIGPAVSCSIQLSSSLQAVPRIPSSVFFTVQSRLHADIPLVLRI